MLAFDRSAQGKAAESALAELQSMLRNKILAEMASGIKDGALPSDSVGVATKIRCYVGNLLVTVRIARDSRRPSRSASQIAYLAHTAHAAEQEPLQYRLNVPMGQNDAGRMFNARDIVLAFWAGSTTVRALAVELGVDKNVAWAWVNKCVGLGLVEKGRLKFSLSPLGKLAVEEAERAGNIDRDGDAERMPVAAVH
jgi:hypothetical protein